jgi:hypothetical protein
MRPSLVHLALAFLLVAKIASAQQTAPLPPFNQPVSCPDGLICIVESCKPWGPNEMCVWRSERNGELINRVNTRRDVLSERLKDCKPVSRPTAPPPQTSGGLQQPTRPPASAPSYLSEMPAVDRILRDVQGKDALDTAARQAGAFWQLRNAIDGFAYAQHRSDRQFTPEEQRLATAYGAAHSAAAQTVQNLLATPEAKRKWFNEGPNYENDRRLLDELLARYLSPASRAEYYGAIGDLDARVRARAEADRKQVQSSANDAVPAQTMPRTSEPAISDPSAAKARAAGVDTKVFGIPMGEPLTLSTCPTRLGFLVDASNTCVEGNPVEGNALAKVLLASVTGPPKEEDPKTKYVRINLEQSLCPQWTDGCAITAAVHQGAIVGAYLITKGYTVEKTTATELKGKYGTPSISVEQHITAHNGLKFTVWEHQWIRPGFYVEYLPVNGIIEVGLVRIETQIGYKIRTEKEREAKKPKL